MAHRKYGTLELVRHEIRGLIKISLTLDSVSHSARDFRYGLDAALKAIDKIEDEDWCLMDLDADLESFDARP
jgi:hypothetical protein